MTTLMTFADVGEVPALLRQMRSTAGMTLKVVADESGLSLSYISEIERKKVKPSLETIDLLAAVYGYDLALVFARATPQGETSE